MKPMKPSWLERDNEIEPCIPGVCILAAAAIIAGLFAAARLGWLPLVALAGN